MEHNVNQHISEIQERNRRVELDKAWETSWTRRIYIMLITYIVACAWMYIIHESLWYLKAIVPVLGFLLSTLSLPSLKNAWMRTH